MTAAHEILLRVDELACGYGSVERPMLADVSLTVGAGEIVTLLGESGSGKTTLLELLFGLNDSANWRGTIDFKAQGALVLQQGACFDHLSVAQNLELVLHKEPRSDLNVEQLLDAVGLSPSLGRESPSRLSGGERQRLCIARALATGGKLLVFDEPTTGLDPSNVTRFAHLLRRLTQEQGVGVLLVTHDMLVAQESDRVLHVAEGVIDPIAPLESGGYTLGHLLAATEAVPEKRDAASGTSRWNLSGLLVPGDLLLTLTATIGALFGALSYLGNALRVGSRTFLTGGLTGLPFYAATGSLLGAATVAVLFAVSPVNPAFLLRYLGANHITALAPALTGFLFAARSGSVLASWVGVMTLQRQLDAMRCLSVEPKHAIHAPVWAGTLTSWLFALFVFGSAMWIGTWAMATFFYGVEDVATLLDPLAIRFLVRHAVIKTVLYALVLPTIILHYSVLPKKRAGDVATCVARQAIVCSLFIIFVEFALALEIRPEDVMRELLG